MLTSEEENRHTEVMGCGGASRRPWCLALGDWLVTQVGREQIKIVSQVSSRAGGKVGGGTSH